MFYFHDPLMNTVSSPVIPPAITRVVEVPDSPLAPPKGWQWSNAKSSPAVAPGTAASGGEEKGKKWTSPSPSTPSPKPVSAPSVPVRPCSAVPANAPSPSTTPAWQPPKGYVLWMGHHSAVQTKAQPSAAPTAALPTWSIVSWKNLAPRRLTGTKEEVIAQVKSDLAAAGVHHLDIQVYDAVHAIVALKAKT
ncbi:hypothetical protein NR402_18570 [Acidithiobacillus ferrooxidans]|uniref:hypothetical protein n=1 Tax=Acidithiobacillus ferrooxidans TaxID=920 RepID=UPI00214BF932|nr:hypothetical protein [Acidithiobacillus ferrooxidans]MCR2832236.1 hypothetical protein [Acidithiobacillus ferrooxidans]